MIKKIFAAVLSLTVIFFAAFNVCAKTTTESENRPQTFCDTVIIDAGHGGFDGGTSGGNILEKDVNLNIALRLANVMRLLGYKVILTRDGDRALDTEGNSIHDKKISDMKNRLKITNGNQNALFLSIHQNNYSSAYVKGAQVFYGGKNGYSGIAAQNIQTEIAQYLQTDNKRQIKKATKDIYLLYNAASPAVLCECGFMSNPQELNNLQNDIYVTKLCLCMGVAISKGM
ncbi:MAG: N-acetylmuramoyl-L-alanine amidase [Oscillospiraceae bacterium]|nr:N-acetylmuramoyl-L-alanine amidase [Candidatus Equicaccousia limihippi]